MTDHAATAREALSTAATNSDTAARIVGVATVHALLAVEARLAQITEHRKPEPREHCAECGIVNTHTGAQQ
jgi:hypothetical protein